MLRLNHGLMAIRQKNFLNDVVVEACAHVHINATGIRDGCEHSMELYQSVLKVRLRRQRNVTMMSPDADALQSEYTAVSCAKYV